MIKNICVELYKKKSMHCTERERERERGGEEGERKRERERARERKRESVQKSRAVGTIFNCKRSNIVMPALQNTQTLCDYLRDHW